VSAIDLAERMSSLGHGARPEHERKKKRKKKHHEKKEMVTIRDEDDDEDEFGRSLALGETVGKNQGDDEEEEDDEDGPVVVVDNVDRIEILRSEQEAPSIRKEAAHKPTKSEKRRVRYDSSSSSGDEQKRPPVVSKARKRHDSSSSDDNDAPRIKRDRSKATKRARRHDSSESDSSEPPTKRFDSDDESSEASRPGSKKNHHHTPGLQSAHDFQTKEQALQAHRRQAASEMVEAHGLGDTVYRKSNSTSGARNSDRKPISAQEQWELNTGRVQKDAAQAAQAEFQQIQQSTFARSSGDQHRDEFFKNQVRAGDPMAQRGTKSSSSSLSAQVGVYRGPPGKPNRYQIRPGYRWDGVDRGNGFEDLLLKQQYSAQHRQEQAYQYSAADM
jgi:pre-mRNA-splicing factor CWC26